MSQRATLARALVNDPRLLILDEPLGKLDSLTRIAMQSELVGFWRRAGFPQPDSPGSSAAMMMRQ